MQRRNRVIHSSSSSKHTHNNIVVISQRAPYERSSGSVRDILYCADRIDHPCNNEDEVIDHSKKSSSLVGQVIARRKMEIEEERNKEEERKRREREQFMEKITETKEMIRVAVGSTRGEEDGQAPRPIYGPGGSSSLAWDNRRDLEVFEGPQKLFYTYHVLGTCCIIPRVNMARVGNTFTILNSPTYAKQLNLCDGQRFFNQPVPAFCSGVAVSPFHILTAGHCFQPRENINFVFGFQMLRAGGGSGSSARLVPRLSNYGTSEVFPFGSSAQITAGSLPESAEDDDDWALVRVADEGNPIPDAFIMPVALSPPAVGEQVLVTGHPSGLPVKVTTRGNVTRIDRQGGTGVPLTATCDLDTFGGNSGSPIFSAQFDDGVHGLLISGETDFVRSATGDCNVPNYLPSSQAGEKFILASFIMEEIRRMNPEAYEQIRNATQRARARRAQVNNTISQSGIPITTTFRD